MFAEGTSIKLSSGCRRIGKMPLLRKRVLSQRRSISIFADNHRPGCCSICGCLRSQNEKGDAKRWIHTNPRGSFQDPTYDYPAQQQKQDKHQFSSTFHSSSSSCLNLRDFGYRNVSPLYALRYTSTVPMRRENTTTPASSWMSLDSLREEPLVGPNDTAGTRTVEQHVYGADPTSIPAMAATRPTVSTLGDIFKGHDTNATTASNKKTLSHAVDNDEEVRCTQAEWHSMFLAEDQNLYREPENLLIDWEKLSYRFCENEKLDENSDKEYYDQGYYDDQGYDVDY
ncbi:hypothetical protein ACA910_015764 [Epithemia clementina (nom. ined.)]